MPVIRILLGEAPAGLHAAVRTAVVNHPDLVLVGAASGEVEVLLRAEHADVVIIGMSGATLSPMAERLLGEYPRIGVVAVDIDQDQGFLYRLRPQLARIGNVTPAGLVAAIRTAANNQAA